ncbi:MAG: DUF4843 domain-containing protein [Bacteroidales bacterium]|nr:DUF4843 domain-containing protein [Bacteroidales bacterium]
MIMKKIIYILPLILLAVVSCKEDTLDVYNGDNYVHFTPSLNGTPEVEYNFALDGMTTAETEVMVPVEIRLWGYTPEAEFKCFLSTVKDKTTAKDSDYHLPEFTLFREGKERAVDTLWVTVKRREKLLDTDYRISVKMDATSDAHIVGPAIYNTVTIHVYDKIQNTPSWWGAHTSDIGAYSAMKYRVLNIFLGKVLRNTDEFGGGMAFKAKMLEFKQWWKDNWDSYEYYAEDGTTRLYDTIPD